MLFRSELNWGKEGSFLKNFLKKNEKILKMDSEKKILMEGWGWGWGWSQQLLAVAVNTFKQKINSKLNSI